MASMVTRTIISTKAKVIFLNPEDNTTKEVEVTLAGTFKKDSAVLNKLKKLYQDAKEQPIFVKSYEEVETLYGMTEDVFLANSVELDPTTRKPLNTEAEANTEE